MHTFTKDQAAVTTAKFSVQEVLTIDLVHCTRVHTNQSNHTHLDDPHR